MVIPSFYPTVGGAEQQLLGLSESLVKCGIKVTIITRSKNNSPSIEKISGCMVLRVGNVRLIKYSFLFYLFIYLLRNFRAYDVIHVHTLNSPLIVASVFAWFIRKPIVAKVTRSGFNAPLSKWRSSRFKSFLFRILFHRVSRFVALTNDIFDELIETGVDRRKVVLIPNGVSVFQKNYIREHDVVRCLYVGRLIPRKRVDLLLQAWFKLDLCLYSCLSIIGDGPEFGRLNEFIVDKGLQNSVNFLGQLPHEAVVNHLYNSDIFILPSSSEGMSNSLLEAMCSGLAVVVSQIKCNQELIKDGENGLVFDNEDELVSVLKYLIHKPEARMSFGLSARKFIIEKFSFDSVANSYKRLYRSIC